MKTIAYWLTLSALIMAIAVLWAYNGVKANADTRTYAYVSDSGTDTTVRTTTLDSTDYPNIVTKIECAGSDVNDMISTCAKALRELCPDGGIVRELGETPAGVLPARIELTIACRHEPAM